MRIAVLSDSHGRQHTVSAALEQIRNRQVDTVIHCGDIDDAATVHLFRGLTAHFVLGNNDTDRDLLRQACADIAATLHEPFGDLELAGQKIAFLHGDKSRLFRDVEQSDYFDYLFYGHTHRAAEHQTGRTRVINPGALHRARPKSFLFVDLHTGLLERVTLENPDG